MPATTPPDFPILDSGAARDRLASVGIGCTAPRVAIAQVLLGGDTHVNAEDVQARLLAQGLRVARATVYNTLRLFTERGLLREVVADPQRRVFDSNLRPHHHVFDVDTGEVWDIPLQTVGGLRDPSTRLSSDAAPATRAPGIAAPVIGGDETPLMGWPAAAGSEVDVVGVDVVIRVRRKHAR